MKHIQTFENYGNSAISNIQVNSGQYIVTFISGGISRKSVASGEMLIGFSTDMIVLQRGNEIITFSPDFNQIARLTLGKGDAVRGVIGPNILFYKESVNNLITYDKNFRELSRQTPYR